jgi:hypothetical protein
MHEAALQSKAAGFGKQPNTAERLHTDADSDSLHHDGLLEEPQLNVGGHGGTQRRLKDYQVTMIGFSSGIGTVRIMIRYVGQTRPNEAIRASSSAPDLPTLKLGQQDYSLPTSSSEQSSGVSCKASQS